MVLNAHAQAGDNVEHEANAEQNALPHEQVLHEDGTVDYVATANQLRRVPNEQNAAIDLANAMAPELWPSDAYRKAVYAHWNMTPPDRTPEMFDASMHDAQRSKSMAIHIQPWREGEHLEAAERLTKLLPNLERFHNNLDGKSFYWPIVDLGPDEAMPAHLPLASALFPQLSMIRSLARLQTMRAMQLAGHDQPIEAFGIIQQIHALGRISNGNTPTLIEHLVALSLINLANEATLGLLSHASLTTDELTQIQTSLANMPPLPNQSSWLPSGSLMPLNAWQAVATGKITYFDLIATIDNIGQTSDDDRDHSASWHQFKPIDFRAHGMNIDEVSDYVRSGYNDMHFACTADTFAEQCNRMLNGSPFLTGGLSTEKAKEDALRIATMYRNPAEAYDSEVAKIVGLHVVMVMRPPFDAANIAWWKAESKHRMVQTVAALRLHHAKTGQWPATLGDAVAAGNCQAEWIQDPFLPEQPLGYRVTEGGFDLWSVFVDLDDDQGLAKEQSQAKSNDPDDDGDWVINFRLAK